MSSFKHYLEVIDQTLCMSTESHCYEKIRRIKEQPAEISCWHSERFTELNADDS